MKNNLKEFKPLINFVKEDKGKLIFASILIFISGVSEICTGWLNGKAVEAITNLDIKWSLIYLGIYLIMGLTLGGIVLHIANSMLYKIESKVKTIDENLKSKLEKAKEVVVNEVQTSHDIVSVLDELSDLTTGR